MTTAVVILAAGLGTRMKSGLPKVLHNIYGIPVLQYAIDAAASLEPGRIVVVVGAEGGERIRAAVLAPPGVELSFARQDEPLGTAHALRAALKELEGFSGTVVVLNGDSPAITNSTLENFLRGHRESGNKLSIASFRASDPAAYGRILRKEDGPAERIVEHADASEAERSVCEVNSGIYALEPEVLELLDSIPLNEKKGEYYLTDIFSLTLSRGLKTDIQCMENAGEEEFLGINTRAELAAAQPVLRRRAVKRAIENGVTCIDPETVHLHPRVTLGPDTVLYPNVHIEGRATIGSGCVIYPNVRIRDSRIGDHVVVRDSSVIEEAELAPHVSVGPFAHIRPESIVEEGAKVGNFVELKKTRFGPGSKAMHLSYLGDAEIGSGVNIGAGTITCNYDGVNKHRTIIEDGVFVGSDTQIVAPARLGKGAYVGAGTTVTQDVPEGSLAVSRTRQKNLEGWVAANRQGGKQ